MTNLDFFSANISIRVCCIENSTWPMCAIDLQTTVSTIDTVQGEQNNGNYIPIFCKGS